jgi:4-hydroxyphenylacetate 3-monooxygenase
MTLDTMDGRAVLLSGAQFKKSLQDGRAVWVDGRRIEDVTEDPTLGPGISLLAEMFDAQHDPAHQDATTYIDESGDRVTRAWQVPRTLEELRDRRKLIEYTTRKTAGTFGRPPDLGPLIGVGMLARKPLFADSSNTERSFADNIDSFVRFGRRANIIAAEVLADPQTNRGEASGESPGLLRVVRHDDDGVYLRGAKSVGSIAAQANEIIFTNLLRPDLPPEACVWASIPVATEGLKLICREGVTRAGTDPYDHPLAHKGEEADQFIIFDDVFVPNERLFNVGDPELLKLYGPVTVWAHWHILTRLWVKAEIFVGTAQLVVDALGTAKYPQVRSHMADLMQYAHSLKAFVLAAENLATLTEGGVMAPEVTLLTAGRLYSIEHYPRIIHLLQELCGQGLVMRFQKAAFDNPEVGPLLDELLPGNDISARDKNRLMNFVWDLTTDSLAGRVELFENVNATPAPFLKERLYGEYDRSKAVDVARDLAGLA